MSLNLSIKNVPDDLAEQLRVRAARNHRSLQGELMAILEAAVVKDTEPTVYRVDPPLGVQPVLPPGIRRIDRPEPPGGWLTIEEVAARARQLFPEGTEQFGRSVDIIREMRDSRDGDHSRR